MFSTCARGLIHRTTEKRAVNSCTTHITAYSVICLGDGCRAYIGSDGGVDRRSSPLQACVAAVLLSGTGTVNDKCFKQLVMTF